jgi:hypothetical protein
MHEAASSFPNNQGQYELGCRNAAFLTVLSGIAAVMDKEAYDAAYADPNPKSVKGVGQVHIYGGPHVGSLLSMTAVENDEDWIPGDLGFVENWTYILALKNVRFQTGKAVGARKLKQMLPAGDPRMEMYEIAAKEAERAAALFQRFVDSCDVTGTQGENIIAGINGWKWGHQSRVVTYNTCENWIKVVSGWETNPEKRASIQKMRLSPSVGLEDRD